MKTHKLLTVVILTGVTLLTCPLAAFAESEFDPSLATKGDDGKTIIKSPDSRSLVIEDSQITVATDSTLKQECLVFSGTQAKPALVSKTYEDATSVSLKFKMKASEDADGTEQTIFMHPGNFELRYNPKARAIILFVYSKGQPNAENVRAVITPGDWNAIEILVKDQQMELKVDSEPTSAKLTGPTMAGANSYFRVGSTQDGARPFHGSISSFTVSEPVE